VEIFEWSVEERYLKKKMLSLKSGSFYFLATKNAISKKNSQYSEESISYTVRKEFQFESLSTDVTEESQLQFETIITDFSKFKLLLIFCRHISQ
jgi:hypothetical protein